MMIDAIMRMRITIRTTFVIKMTIIMEIINEKTQDKVVFLRFGQVIWKPLSLEPLRNPLGAPMYTQCCTVAIQCLYCARPSVVLRELSFHVGETVALS